MTVSVCGWGECESVDTHRSTNTVSNLDSLCVCVVTDVVLDRTRIEVFDSYVYVVVIAQLLCAFVYM